MSDDLEAKRNHEINIDRGEAVSRLRSSTDWHLMTEIKQNLLQDLYKGLFIPATEGKSLYNEPTYAQILAHRHGCIEGVNQFFTLLDKYEKLYLDNKGGQ